MPMAQFPSREDKMEPVDLSCQFCILDVCGASSHYATVMGDDEFQEIIYRDEYLTVIPDVAPCVAGHTLIVSRKHQRSLIEHWESGRLCRLLQIIEKTLSGDGFGVVAFEHGILGSTETKSCVEHSHVHIIPFAREIRNTLEIELGRMVRINCPDATSLNGGPAYALLRDISGQWYVHNTGPIPGQVIRRAVTGISNESPWDWMDFVEFAIPLETRQRIFAGREIYAQLGRALQSFYHGTNSQHVK
jgi:diadenosine tetraphosphate (Ap4A) HIT family hydrolase